MSNPVRRLARRLIDLLPPRLQCRIASLRNRNTPSLGPSAFVHPSVQMLGKAFVRVGTNSVLSEHVWLNVNKRSGSYKAIDIGDHCFIGRRNFFSSGNRIVIGHYVLTANDCQFLGSSHVVDDPMRLCINTGTTDTDTITIGPNTFIGAGARVLGNVTVGHGCVIGACALVTRDVPPFSQVHGSPARVQRRYSFARSAWVPVADFNEADATAIPTEQEYLRHLRQQPTPVMPYLAAGSDMGNC